MSTHALVVFARAERGERWIEVDGLSDLQDAVGGDIEMVTHSDRVVAFINDEGKFIAGCVRNERATRLLAHNMMPGDYIAGDAIFCGFDPETGENADLPPEFGENIA